MADQPKLVIAGNSDEAQKAVAQLERRFDSLEQRLKRVRDTSKQAGKDAGDAFKTAPIDAWMHSISSAASKLATIGTIGMVVKAAVSGIGDQFKQVNNEISEFWKKQRDAELKLKIQGGFTPEEVRDQIPAMKQALWNTPVAKVPEAVELQTQLAGAGFNKEDVKSGAAIQSILDLKAVTNAWGEDVGDPKETVLGMSQLVKGLGNVEPRAGDLKRIGAKVAMLMEKSDIQFEDLGELAGEAATLKQFGMSESEQLGAFSWMRDVKGASEGATGLRIFTSRTATAGTDKGRTESLQSIGLKPEDVAIAQGGVKFEEAVTKIQAGMAKLSEEDKNKFLVEMYGEKGQASAAIMLDQKGSKEISNRIKMADNAQGMFQKRLDTFQESENAVTARASVSADFAKRQAALRDGDWGQVRELRKNQRQLQMEAQPDAASRRSVAAMHWVGGTVESLAEMSGMKPNELMGGSMGKMLEAVGQMQLLEIKRQTGTVEEQVKVLRNIERLMMNRAGININRNAQVEN